MYRARPPAAPAAGVEPRGKPTLRRTFRRLLESLERRDGTEFSRAAAERARGSADRVHLGGLEQLTREERYRLAACIHVIEHVYDPVAFVARLREHLEPGGWLILGTPDMGGFWRPLLGRRWPFYKMPEHVTYFDRRSLGRLLEAGGFEEVQALPYASYFTLDLIAQKLGLRLGRPLARLALRLPATTVALAGRAP